MSRPEACAYQVYAGDYLNPPEYCPNDALPDEEYCPEHLPPEWDDEEERWVEDWWDPVDFYEGDTE